MGDDDGISPGHGVGCVRDQHATQPGRELPQSLCRMGNIGQLRFDAGLCRDGRVMGDDLDSGLLQLCYHLKDRAFAQVIRAGFERQPKDRNPPRAGRLDQTRSLGDLGCIRAVESANQRQINTQIARNMGHRAYLFG